MVVVLINGGEPVVIEGGNASLMAVTVALGLPVCQSESTHANEHGFERDIPWA